MSDHNPTSSWTGERVATLRKLHAEGQSDAQIAKALGGTTRFAVLGKRHRIGLVNSAAAVKATQKCGAVYANRGRSPHSAVAVADAKRDLRAYGQIGAIKTTHSAPLAEERPDAISTLPRPWEGRKARECAYPVKTVAGVTFSCCAPSIEPGPSRQYCAAHAALMWTHGELTAADRKRTSDSYLRMSRRYS